MLAATDMELGTCWIGGTFTRSRFSQRISLTRSDNRLPWQEVFYDGGFQRALAREEADRFAAPLEMVRLGPSASNRQPWRIVRDGPSWHFYLKRTKGYRSGLGRLFRMSDVQRLDMGLSGSWTIRDPGIRVPDPMAEYVVSWVT